MKRIIIIFLVFFLGTSGLIAADTSCRETTGKGGNLSLKIKRQEDGAISAEFLGQRARWEF